MKRMYYIANARMPTEKAHGIQIAKMCEAFIEAGAEVVLVVPRRGNPTQTLQAFYGLRVAVPTVRLFTLDLYNYERTGYFLASLSFMLSSLLFLWWKRMQGERFVAYTVDLDVFSSSQLAFLTVPLISEMHGGKPDNIASRVLFARARGIVTINTIIRDELQKTFPRSPARYLVEPNGVDIEAFNPQDKTVARQKLGLPSQEKIAFYVGRFFDWKGLEILAQAAALAPEIAWYIVGGTKEEFSAFVPKGVGALPKNLMFPGPQLHSAIPSWLAAADALVVLGTQRDTQSYYYTSPMKLFEYLLMERPVVASKTPAIEAIVSEREVFFYEPDKAESLAEAVRYTMLHAEEAKARTEAARAKGEQYSWKGRAKRILEFIEALGNRKI